MTHLMSAVLNNAGVVVQQLLAAKAAVDVQSGDVVEFTTYVVGRSSIRGYLDGRGQVYPDIYPDGEFPTNTLLVVAGLVNEDLLVEIKAVAALP